MAKVQDRAKAQKLFDNLYNLRMVMGGEYTPQQLEILLLCYLQQGITQTEISQRLNMPQASVSRNCLKLGRKAAKDPQGRFKVVGAGLVQMREDEIYDSRRHAVWLTDAGKKLIVSILDAVKN
jgi:DNA-binding MarR family transcriptional regulator